MSKGNTTENDVSLTSRWRVRSIPVGPMHTLHETPHRLR